MTPPLPPEEIAKLMQFIARKSQNVTSPMNMKELSRQFTVEVGSDCSADVLTSRVHANRHKIHEMNEFDKDTKVKMMFALSAPIDAGFLIELKKEADVEVDDQQRITKYKANNGSLELNGEPRTKSNVYNRLALKARDDIRWQSICLKANMDPSKVERNYGEDLEKFLIKRTKNATSPLNITRLAEDFKAEFNRPEPCGNLAYIIRKFRQNICNMDQFDNPMKVKMIFALSAPVDAAFLKKLQKDAIVELNEKWEIVRYKAKDGSLELEGDHSQWAKAKARTEIQKVADKSDQSSSSSAISTQDKSQKRQRESESDDTQEPMPTAPKKGRSSNSSPEVKDKKESEEDEGAMTEDDHNGEDIDYDIMEMVHVPVEKKPETLGPEVKTESPDEIEYLLVVPKQKEGPSTSLSQNAITGDGYNGDGAQKKASINTAASPKIMAPSTGRVSMGRSFVLKHVFENVSKFEEKTFNYGEEEDHYGLTWSISVYKDDPQLGVFLKCRNPSETEKWAIDTNCTAKIIKICGKTNEEKIEEIGENLNRTGWNVFEAAKSYYFKNLDSDFSEGDKLSVEVHVKINKMTGVYKENREHFDETMKNYSDLALIVKDQKFYVDKHLLARRSPYFDSLLPLLESSESEVELTGIEPEDFQNFLEVLYGAPSIDEITVEGILLVADMYDTSIVIEKCEEFLMNESKKSMIKKFQMAIRYNLDQLQKKCLSEITTKGDIQSMMSVKDLDRSIMAVLLEKAVTLII